MFATILGFITGLAGPITQIVSKISDLKMKRLQAESDVALKEIDAQIEQAHDRKAYLIALAGNRISSVIMTIMTIILSLPALAIMAKYAYDKTVGPFYGCVGKVIPKNMIMECKQFTMDSIDPNVWWIILAVYGLFFLSVRFKR
jgi:hypothetical protein